MTTNKDREAWWWCNWYNNRDTSSRTVWRSYPIRIWCYWMTWVVGYMLLTLVSTRKDTKSSTRWENTWSDNANSMRTSRGRTFCSQNSPRISTISTRWSGTILSLRWRLGMKSGSMWSIRTSAQNSMVGTRTAIWPKAGSRPRRPSSWGSNSISCLPKRHSGSLLTTKTKLRSSSKTYRVSSRSWLKGSSSKLTLGSKGHSNALRMTSFSTLSVRSTNLRRTKAPFQILMTSSNSLLRIIPSWISTWWINSSIFTSTRGLMRCSMSRSHRLDTRSSANSQKSEWKTWKNGSRKNSSEKYITK